MTSIIGTILSIEKVNISRKNKGLPDIERVDLILLPDKQNNPCRFQVRKDEQPLLGCYEPKDKVEVYFIIELNEIRRDGVVKRFDNNIFKSIRKTA